MIKKGTPHQDSCNVGDKKGLLEITAVSPDKMELTVKCAGCQNTVKMTREAFNHSSSITCGCGKAITPHSFNKICTICGAEIKDATPRQKYCIKCGVEEKKNIKKKYQERKKAGKSIQIGVTIGKCAVCNSEFIYNSARQKYCEKCKIEATKTAVNKLSLERYTKSKDETNQKRYTKRKIIKGNQ